MAQMTPALSAANDAPTVRWEICSASTRRSGPETTERHASCACPTRPVLAIGAILSLPFGAAGTSYDRARSDAARIARGSGLNCSFPLNRGGHMEMISRIKAICLKPNAEWPVIEAETTSTRDLMMGYVAP